MRLNELRKEDIIRANGLYEWYMDQNMYYKGDLGTFIEDYLERCSECGELYFDSDMVVFEEFKVCKDCQDMISDYEIPNSYEEDYGEE